MPWGPMRLFRTTQRLRVLLSSGGAFGLAFLYLGPPGALAPEIGLVAPVYAAPAEQVEVRSIGAGQTLGAVVAPVLAAGEQHAFVLAFQEQADPRRMGAGTEVMLRYRSEDRWLRGVDVTLSPDETVRLTRDAFGWHSSIMITPLWTDTLFASGTIENVLWNAVVGSPALAGMPQGDRALLIDRLDRVFQWQVDFSRQIQKGDTYRFAFERQVRPDGSTHSGRILSAELVNAGRSLYAVWFDVDGEGTGSYYDLEGMSLRRAFLLKPLEYRHISSPFTNGRLHPVLGTWRAHRGVDYAAATGTPVMATADGTISTRANSGSYGNLVEIRHTNGYITRYAHLSRFGAGQAVGRRVSQGEIIGYVGATGLATGPHLHYEMIRAGQHIDPLSVTVPTGEPVPSAAVERWNEERAVRMALLDVLPGLSSVRFAAHVSSDSPARLEVEGGGAGDARGEGGGQ